MDKFHWLRDRGQPDDLPSASAESRAGASLLMVEKERDGMNLRDKLRYKLRWLRSVFADGLQRRCKQFLPDNRKLSYNGCCGNAATTLVRVFFALNRTAVHRSAIAQLPGDDQEIFSTESAPQPVEKARFSVTNGRKWKVFLAPNGLETCCERAGVVYWKSGRRVIGRVRSAAFHP